MKFKVGDRVVIHDDSLKVYGVEPGTAGEVIKIADDDDCSYYIRWDKGIDDKVWWASEDADLRLEQKTLYDVELGDILIDGDGSERHVLGRCGEVVFMTWNSDRNTEANIHSVKYLERNGWKVKGAEPDVKEMTVAEISKELGYDVKVVE